MRRLRAILLGVVLLLVVYAFHWRSSMARTRKYVYWWLLAAMLIIIGNMLQGCTRLRVVTRPAILVDSLGETMSGKTICDLRGDPVIVVDQKVAGSWFLKYTIIHEYVHVAQAHRLSGGCRELVSRYLTDSLFRLAVEGEAYCEVWRQENVDHVGTHNDWLWLVHAMSQYGEEKDIPCTEYPP